MHPPLTSHRQKNNSSRGRVDGHACGGGPMMPSADPFIQKRGRILVVTKPSWPRSSSSPPSHPLPSLLPSPPSHLPLTPPFCFPSYNLAPPPPTASTHLPSLSYSSLSTIEITQTDPGVPTCNSSATSYLTNHPTYLPAPLNHHLHFISDGSHRILKQLVDGRSTQPAPQVAHEQGRNGSSPPGTASMVALSDDLTAAADLLVATPPPPPPFLLPSPSLLPPLLFS